MANKIEQKILAAAARSKVKEGKMKIKCAHCGGQGSGPIRLCSYCKGAGEVETETPMTDNKLMSVKEIQNFCTHVKQPDTPFVLAEYDALQNIKHTALAFARIIKITLELIELRKDLNGLLDALPKDTFEGL